MQVRISNELKPHTPDLTNWYIDPVKQGCYGGLGCRDCPLFLPAKKPGSCCILFHTLPETQLRAVLSSLLEKHRDETVEFSAIRNDYPEIFL